MFYIYMIYICFVYNYSTYVLPFATCFLDLAVGLQGPQSYLGSWSLRRYSQLSENSFPAFARHLDIETTGAMKKNLVGLGYIGDKWVVVSNNYYFFHPYLGKKYYPVIWGGGLRYTFIWRS